MSEHLTLTIALAIIAGIGCLIALRVYITKKNSVVQKNNKVDSGFIVGGNVNGNISVKTKKAEKSSDK